MFYFYFNQVFDLFLIYTLHPYYTIIKVNLSLFLRFQAFKLLNQFW